MKRLQERHNFVPKRQNKMTFGFKIPTLDTETSQRQTFNAYKLVQDGYLKNVGITDDMEHTLHTR